MEENRKQVLDTFEKHLQTDFANYCEKHEIENNAEAMVTYLIDRQLLTARIIRRYTIIREFDRLYTGLGTSKSKKVELLADRFNLSSRHVWSLIKYSQRLDQKKKDI